MKMKGLLFLIILGFPTLLFAQDKKSKGGQSWKVTEFSKVVSQRSPLLKESRLNIEIAEIILDQSRIAMWPQIALIGRYTRLSETRNDGLFSAPLNSNTQALVLGVDDPEAQQLWINLGQQNAQLAESSAIDVPEDFWSLDLELKLPISDWFMTLGPRKRAARSMLDSQKARLKAEQKGLQFRAQARFYSLAQKRMIVELGQSRLKDAREKLRVARAAEEVGALRRSDLLRLQSFVHQLEASLSSALAEKSEAKEELIVLLGAEAEDDFVSPDFSEPLSPIQKDSNSLYQSALARRGEIEAMREGKRALGQQRESISGARWPKLEVRAKASLANPNTRFTPLREEFDATWEASAILSWSPNLLFLNAAGEEKLKMEERKIDAKIEVFRNTLASQIRVSLAKDSASLKIVASAKKAMLAFEEVYQLRQVEYEAGTITLSDLLESETDLSVAKIGWINANIQARLTRKKLSWLSGIDFP